MPNDDWMLDHACKELARELTASNKAEPPKKEKPKEEEKKPLLQREIF